MKRPASPRTRQLTPIERIFTKVMGREMTPAERACFQLDSSEKKRT